MNHEAPPADAPSADEKWTPELRAEFALDMWRGLFSEPQFKAAITQVANQMRCHVEYDLPSADAKERARQMIGNVHNYLDEDSGELSMIAFMNLSDRIAAEIAEKELQLELVTKLADRLQKEKEWLQANHAAEKEKVRSESFDQGYICATAEIMRTHGEDVVAWDVLRGNMPKDWTIIDEYDRKALQPVLDHHASVEAMRASRQSVEASHTADIKEK